MSNAVINDASGEWYLGVYCRKCQAPVPVFRDPGRGAAVTAGTGKLTVACPRCGKKAHYAAREVISFLVYADRAQPADRAPVNDDQPVRDNVPMSEATPPSGVTPVPPAQPILELGPEIAVEDDEEPALEFESAPAPDDATEVEPVLELGPELAVDDDASVDHEAVEDEAALAVEPEAEETPAHAVALAADLQPEPLTALATSEDHQTPPDVPAPAPIATRASELPIDEPAAIATLLLEWLPIEPPIIEPAVREKPVIEPAVGELAVSDPVASELPAGGPVDEPVLDAPGVEESAVDETPPVEIPADASPDIGSLIAKALAAAAGEDEPAPAAEREAEAALAAEPEPPLTLELPSQPAPAAAPEPEPPDEAPLFDAESEPVAETDPFLELVAAFETAEPPPTSPEIAAPPPSESPASESALSEAPAVEITASPSADLNDMADEPPAVEPVAEAPTAEAPVAEPPLAEAPISAAPTPEPAPPSRPPVAPVAPVVAANLVAPQPIAPKSVAPKSIAQVYRERWADAAARPQVIVELRPVLRTLKARADATDYDVLARVAEQFLDYLAQVPAARQNAAAIEQYINAVFALALRGPVKGTDAVGEAMAASLRAVNRHAGLYRAA